MLPRNEGHPHRPRSLDSDLVPDPRPAEPAASPSPVAGTARPVPGTHDAAGDAVVVSGLVKRYGRTEAVRGLDLRAPTGRLTAVLGPNGAGKTTTVECCEGLRSPDAGRVRVLGLDPVRDRRHLRPRVGVMLQDGGLPSTVPALEVLHHVASTYRSPRPVPALVERLGLGTFARTQVRRLSGGQRQRLALACAVVGGPELVFLDEPGSGLDPQARLAVWDLVRELRREGTTIVLTTHQMAEAEALADHVVVVDDGRAIATGTVAELLGKSDVVRVALAPAPGTTDLPALAADLARHVPGPVTVAAGGPVLEVHAPGTPATLHAVTGWAADRDVVVTSLTAGRRTLEDVFLDLTGRSLR